MRKGFRAALFASLGTLVIGPPALASTRPLQTYDFTFLTGWVDTFGDPIPFTATGSFTGYLEPSGFIEQGDLTDFAAVFNSSISLTSVNFFSFNPAGGASSLDFIASASSAVLCAGAAATLSPACNPAGTNPSNAIAAFLESGTFLAATPSFPDVTLVSSVTSVPEPATWTMLLIGLAGVGLARRRKPLLSPT